MLTALILTGNSAPTVENCLRSLQWCNRIIVVDSYSTDGTVEICRKFATRIYQNPFSSYGEQLNWALKRLNTPWVFVVDSDEEVSLKLQEEVKNLFKGGDPPLDGYYIRRKSKFLGRWIYHSGWYPDYVLRLFRRDKTQYRKRRLGSSPLIKGITGYLKEELLHYPYADLTHYIEKFSKYTRLSAEQMYQEGRRAHLYDISLRPLLRFFKDYLFRGSFLDGTAGFIISVLSSYYVFMKYTRLWEIQKKSSE